MSNKPEKIWLIQMDDYNLVWSDCPDPTNGETIPDEDRTEYIRADLAKPSEWISVETIDKFIGQVRSEEYRANSCYEKTKQKYFDGSGDSYKHCAELLTELIKAIQPLPPPPPRETP